MKDYYKLKIIVTAGLMINILSASLMRTTEIDLSPKAMALGSTQVALACSVDTILYNPAGLVFLPNGKQFYSSSIQGFDDMSQTVIIGYGQKYTSANALAVVFDSTVVNDISHTIWEGGRPVIVNDFGYSSSQLIIGVSQVVYGTFNAGVSLKLYHKQLAQKTGFGAGIDFGLSYIQGEKDNFQINLGLNIINIGATKIKWTNGVEDSQDLLPVVGVAMSAPAFMGNIGIICDLELDAIKKSSVGAFYNLTEVLEIRAGYNEAQQISYGVGLNLFGYNIDYAEVEQEYLGRVKQVSMRASF